MPFFDRDDLVLHWSESGTPEGSPVVLLHGLLFSSRLFDRLAARVTGYRVLLLELHGHGRSAKPTDPARYSWAEFDADLMAFLDHLGIERAVVGGLSLGANATLFSATHHPERMAGLLFEMPVLDQGHAFANPTFTAMARAYGLLGPAGRMAAGAMRRLPVPRRLPEMAALRDVAGQPPAVVQAVLRGLLAEPPLAAGRADLATLPMPALVIGHRGDPLHPLADSEHLARHLPAAELVVASSILEHRIRVAALANHVERFLRRVTW